MSNTWLQIITPNGTPLNQFAAMVNKIPQTVNCDSIEITGILYDKEKGVLQVAFSFGGYKTNGKFAEDPTYGKTPMRLSWSRSQHAKLWNQLNLDNFIPTKMISVVEQLLIWIHAGDVVKELGARMKLPVPIKGQVADTSGNVVLAAKSDPTPPIFSGPGSYFPPAA